VKSRKTVEGNVVIIALHKLGDSVFTIPAIREIQENHKKKIIIICYPEVVPIYRLGLYGIDFCTIEHKHFYFNDRFADRKARKLLKTTNPEIMYDLTGVMTSATLIFNSKAKEIIGMNREQFKGIYDKYCEIRQKPHLKDKYLDIASLNIEINSRHQITGVSKKNVHQGTILIHPFAGWKAKEWNLNKFIQLAMRLKSEYNVCLVAKQNDISEDVAREIENLGIELIQLKSINDLIIKIKECSAFIGNDSGPIYIASLLDKPTFTLFGPTNPEFSLSSGEHHRYIAKLLQCSPAKNTQYCFTQAGQSGCPAFQCMNLLGVDEVYNNLVTFLDDNGIKKN
jgi:ADP-heptose:LPS heptosyltransferase